MILVFHELGDLRLASIKFLNDLSISLSHSKTVISLARSIIIKSLLSILLGSFPFVELLFIVVSHGRRPLVGSITSCFQSLLHLGYLLCAEHRQLFVIRHISPTNSICANRHVFSISLRASRLLYFMRF